MIILSDHDDDEAWNWAHQVPGVMSAAKTLISPSFGLKTGEALISLLNSLS